MVLNAATLVKVRHFRRLEWPEGAEIMMTLLYLLNIRRGRQNGWVLTANSKH